MAIDQLEAIFDGFQRDLAAATTLEDVQGLRRAYVGKKGRFTRATRGIDFSAIADPGEVRAVGQRINELQDRIREALDRAEQQHAAGAAAAVDFDPLLPGTPRQVGHLHPVSLTQMEVESVMQSMGFLVLSGFEVETEYANFDSLNIPADHPARDMQDTFWLDTGHVLRTHTSASQVRAMREHGVPLRAVFAGRCFRNETVDASHENTFYQLEGLYVDEHVTIGNLIAVMKAMLAEIFGRDVTVRLRPGYFPFVEPGFELDIRCLLCGGDGCATCKRSGWLELLPCGMVHPTVLEHGGVDPARYSGFAFGLGLTRLAMMRFGIGEIRVLNAGDVRALEQFPAVC